MSRPQRNEQCCTACDGAGLTQDVDYVDGDRRLVVVRCEACLGLGVIRDCDRCDEPTPVPELEDGGGKCSACRAELESQDQRADMRRIAGMR